MFFDKLLDFGEIIMGCRFLTVDVFTGSTFDGAQIAVVPKAQNLTTELMQKIAAELNLWRTVFVVAEDKNNANFSIRIFNQKKEFEFGGHATIGAIHALAQEQALNLVEGENNFTLNEAYGNVACTVEISGGKPVFQQFTSQAKIEIDRFTPTIEELSEFLTIKPYHLNVNGFNPLLVASHVPYLFVPVDNYASLSHIDFDYKAWAASSAPATFASSIFLFTMSENIVNGESQPHFHCRMVGPHFSHHEDPPIGAAMPAFSAYLHQFSVGKNLPLNFIAERGAFAGRKSEIHVEVLNASDNTVEVKIGGKAILASQGELYL